MNDLEGNIITQAQVDEWVSLHETWVNNRSAGKRLVIRDCNLTGVVLKGRNLWRAEISNCSLIGADLSDVQAVFADFYGCDMRLVNFALADLSHADLRHCNLLGASLFNADISDANLRGAKMAPDKEG